MDVNSLDRFLYAQEKMYATALKEIRTGRKLSHWMWYIFPQLRGLGSSERSYIYGINGIKEAREYLAHPVLSKRLIEISEAFLSHKGRPAEEILGDMGRIDAKKLKSSMTLFAYISEENSVFHQILQSFFNGNQDKRTLKMIEKEF